MMIKRTICLLMTLLCITAALIPVGAAQPEMSFDVLSQSALLINTDTDTVIFEKQADKKQPTIAFNKIVTAIIALEETDDIDARYVKVSHNAVANLTLGGYGSGIKEDEEYTMRDMLSMILISSANDCCIAIAEEVAGDEDSFVDKMNSLMQRLECADTLFTDVHGIDDEEQYTTCNDMKKILDYARTLPNFYDICSLSSCTIGGTSQQEEKKITTNIAMMDKTTKYYYSAVRGIKYGHSPSKGRNFASLATKNGYNYMLITMNGPIKDSSGNKMDINSSFTDAENLFKWAFDNYRIKQLFSENVPVADVKVKFSLDSNTVQAIPETAITAILPKDINTNSFDSSSELVYETDLPETLTAPVNKGQVLGTLTVKLDGKVLGEVSLLAAQSLNKSEYVYILEKIKSIASHTWFKVILIVLAALILIYVTIAIVSNFRRTARKKLQREKMQEMRNGKDKKRSK